jgi:AcrR family transcriptional regulator
MARTLSSEAHELLVDAIDEVLYEQGLHEGTIDSICARAGVSKPALYRHFGDREQLIVDYLRRRRTRRMAEMEAAVEAAGRSSRRRVLALIDWVGEWITSEEFRGCGFHRALQQRPSELDTLITITRDQKQWLESLLYRELEPLVERPEQVARHLFLLVEGALAAGSYRDPTRVAADLRSR